MVTTRAAARRAAGGGRRSAGGVVGGVGGFATRAADPFGGDDFGEDPAPHDAAGAAAPLSSYTDDGSASAGSASADDGDAPGHDGDDPWAAPVPAVVGARRAPLRRGGATSSSPPAPPQASARASASLGGGGGTPSAASVRSSGVFSDGIRSPFEEGAHAPPVTPAAGIDGDAEGDGALGALHADAHAPDNASHGASWRASVGDEDAPVGCEVTPPMADAPEAASPASSAGVAPREPSFGTGFGGYSPAVADARRRESARDENDMHAPSAENANGGARRASTRGSFEKRGAASPSHATPQGSRRRGPGGYLANSIASLGGGLASLLGGSEHAQAPSQRRYSADAATPTMAPALQAEREAVDADDVRLEHTPEHQEEARVEHERVGPSDDEDAGHAGGSARAGSRSRARGARAEKPQARSALPEHLPLGAELRLPVTPANATTPYQRVALHVLQSVGKTMRAPVFDSPSESDAAAPPRPGATGRQSYSVGERKREAYLPEAPRHVPLAHRLAAADAATRAAVHTALRTEPHEPGARHALVFVDDDGAALRCALALDGPLLDADGNAGMFAEESCTETEDDDGEDEPEAEPQSQPPRELLLTVADLKGAVSRHRSRALLFRKGASVSVSLGEGDDAVRASAPMRRREPVKCALDLGDAASRYLVPFEAPGSDDAAEGREPRATDALPSYGEQPRGAGLTVWVRAGGACFSAAVPWPALRAALAAAGRDAPESVPLATESDEDDEVCGADDRPDLVSMRCLPVRDRRPRESHDGAVHTLRFTRVEGDCEGEFAGEAALLLRVVEAESYAHSGVAGEEAHGPVDVDEHVLAQGTLDTTSAVARGAVAVPFAPVSAHETYDALVCAALHTSLVGPRHLRCASEWQWLLDSVALRFGVSRHYQAIRYALHCLHGFASCSAECMALLEELLGEPTRVASASVSTDALARRERVLLAEASERAVALCDRALAEYRTLGRRESSSLRSLHAALRLRNMLGVLTESDASLRKGAESLWREMSVRAAAATQQGACTRTCRSGLKLAAGTDHAEGPGDSSSSGASSDDESPRSDACIEAERARPDPTAVTAERLALLAGAVAEEVRNDLAVERIVRSWNDVPVEDAPSFAVIAAAVLGRRLCIAARAAAEAAACTTVSPEAIAASVRAAVALRECRIALSSWGLPHVVLDGMDAYGEAVQQWVTGLAQRFVRMASVPPPPPARRGAPLANGATYALTSGARGSGCLSFVADAYHGLVDSVAPLAPLAATWPDEVFPALGKAAADIDAAALETLVEWWAQVREAEASLSAAESMRKSLEKVARACGRLTACLGGEPLADSPGSPRGGARSAEHALVRDRFRLVTPARAAYLNTLKHMLDAARRSVHAALRELAEGAPTEECGARAKAAAAAASAQLRASALTLEGLYAAAVTELEDEVARAALGGGGVAMAASLADVSAVLAEAPEMYAALCRGNAGTGTSPGLPADLDDAVGPLAGALAPRVFKEVCRGVWARSAQTLRAALYNGGLGPTRGADAGVAYGHPDRRRKGDASPQAATALLEALTAYFRGTLSRALGDEMRPEDGREPSAARELRRVLARVVGGGAGGSASAHHRASSQQPTGRGRRDVGGSGRKAGILSPVKGQSHRASAAGSRRPPSHARRSGSGAGLTPCKELLDSVRATAAADPSSWLETAPSEDRGRQRRRERGAEGGGRAEDSYVSRWSEISSIHVSQSVALS